MDPMQVQNNQPVQNPNPGQIPVQTAPMGGIPVYGQVMPQQVIQPGYPVQPVGIQQVIQQPIQQEGIFDKILKGIIGIIAKLAGQPDPITGKGGIVQQVIQQPGVQGQPVQQPGFFGQIGSTLENIANQTSKVTESGVSSAVQGAQNYIQQPIQQPVVQQEAPIPTTIHMGQQLLSQNYQPNTNIQQPVVQQIPSPPTVPPQQ